MSKDLPYFRFTVSEYQNGKVSIEDYSLQGFFINVVCYYWSNDCSVTLALLKKRFRNDEKMIDLLIKNEIIFHDKTSDFIQINFLNEQFDVLSEQRKLRQEAGSKGGKQRSSNAKAKLKQSSSYKDKDNNKDKDKYNNYDFSIFSDQEKPLVKEWIEYRKQIKHPLTELSVKKLPKIIQKIGGADRFRELIDISISSGYQGLIPDKLSKQEKTDQPQKMVIDLNRKQ